MTDDTEGTSGPQGGGVDPQFQWILDLDLQDSPADRPQSLPAPRTRDRPTPAVLSGSALAQVLAKVPLFRGLHKPQLKKLLRLCVPISFAAGDRVCSVGEPSDQVMILLSGELAVSVADGTCVARVYPVTTVGEMGFVTKWKRTASLTALSPCALMRLPNSQLRALLQADAGLHLKVLQNIVAILAARIVHLNSLMRDQLRSGG